MAHSLEAQIRSHLADYLDHALTLSEFKRWLVQTTWGRSSVSDAEASALRFANTIKLLLDEESGGWASETDVRAELAAVLATPSGSVAGEPLVVGSGS